MISIDLENKTSGFPLHIIQTMFFSVGCLMAREDIPLIDE